MKRGREEEKKRRKRRKRRKENSLTDVWIDHQKTLFVVLYDKIQPSLRVWFAAMLWGMSY